MENLKSDYWRVRSRALVFLENLVYTNSFSMTKYDFITPLFELLADENKNVSDKA